MTDDYTPTEDQFVEAWKRYSRSLDAKYARMSDGDAEDEARHFITQVKRDAARSALDGLAAHEMDLHSRDPEVYAECKHVAVSARSWRETHYRLPETED